MTDQVPSNSPSIDPCPFCREAINPSGDESWYFRGDGPPPSYAVRCDSCGAQGPYGNGKFRKDYAGAQAEAVRLWNERARAAHEPRALRIAAERVRDHACAYNAPADSLLVKRELIGALAQALGGSISEWPSPPPRADDPNEGPIGPDGLLVVPDGVLPPFYNGWKCSQCGKDPEAIKANGPCSCGRGKPSLTKSGE